MKVWMYGREATALEIILEDEDFCAACEFVQANVADGEGVSFIEVAEKGLFRVEQISECGCLPRALFCQRVSKREADRELLQESDA